MYKILILADINSSHTEKWVNALLENNFSVFVFSLTARNEFIHAVNTNHTVITPAKKIRFIKTGNLSRINYLFVLPELKKCIQDFEPDILHAHYASSYGLLGALTGFSPFFISVWGSDILSFPHKSFIHKKVLVYSLRRATRVFATGKLLKDEVKKISGVESEVVPFGINLNVFYPKRSTIYYSESELVIGTIKSMEKIYRIDWIIKAFAEVQRLRPDKVLRLLLVGDGAKLSEYLDLATKTCQPGTFTFTGKVPHSQIPELTAQLDIFVHAAFRESFGVSTLEAAACGKPAVVCNSGGAPEVVIENETALLYDEDNFDQLISHLLTLVDNETRRREMGQKARAFVMDKFDWNKNVQKMIASYKAVVT